MGSIKRQFNRAYILLESLITLSLLMIITSVVLAEVTAAQKSSASINQQIEVLNIGEMALDKGDSSLQLNGTTVRLYQDEQHFLLKDAKGSEALNLEILEVKK